MMKPWIGGALLTLLAIGAAAADDAAVPVTFIPASTVVGAFAKGSPLFEGPAYKVHASRREKPGQVEVHVKDTDIIYVLEGTVMFVTGGQILGGAPTAPEEIRGAEIKGGESRQLRKGDVVIVPNGVPHWFKEVPGPFTYYVVKVRDASAGGGAGGAR